MRGSLSILTAVFGGVKHGRRQVSSGLTIESWAFWSPEGGTPREWRDHWTKDGAVAQLGRVPDDAVPVTHRRRMSALSRLAVQIGLQAGRESRADFLVFCSQHGELVRSRELLGCIATSVELSPTAFSQSVHNTSAGLYTIVSQSRVPATALASGPNTFAYGWLEAEAYLLENPWARVLLVSYEDLLPAEYLPYSAQKQCMYGLGLLLRAERSGLTLDSVAAETDELLPMAPLFMAWWLSDEPAVQITAEGQGWAWKRNGS
ncbi:MAG TPA: beta-ketoacyl synthase chain length factor [Gammaproteobacteria bacterium]|nr:beta-ketoacyl synthase chain length factor [Gammaproteobacteria bacterium]